MRRILVLAALLALVTTACKLEFNLAADLGPDATGTVTIEVGFDDEAAGFFLSDTDPFEDAPPGAETSIEERGELTFYLITQSFVNEDELVTLMTGEEAPFETFDATFADDLVTVTGTVGGTGGFFEEGDLTEFTPDQLAESLSAEVRITMPGRVLEHDADTIEGNTLTWEIDLLGSPLTVSARSDPAGVPDEGDGGIPAWVVAPVAICIVAGVGYFMYRRSRGRPVFEPEPPTT
jgi:hypothetical protein